MDEDAVGCALRGTPVVVTGGAGYVGSAVAHALARLGARVTVIDTLAAGHAWAAEGLSLIVKDVRDVRGMTAVLRETGARALCHLAALATIPESFERPDEYEDVNVGGTHALLAAARETGVPVFVFASTCAVYATPSESGARLREGDAEAPLSPYAATKLAAERAVLEADARGELRAAVLRFFNAAGADRVARIGEAHEPETHAVPRVLRWALGRGEFTIFGTDYPTRDGTCVRDYVHTADLAWAHALAAASLLVGREQARGVFNLGSGVGTTVRELVERACALVGTARRPPVGPRREGDAPVLLADITRAQKLLGWQPRRGLDETLADALWWEEERRARAGVRV